MNESGHVDSHLLQVLSTHVPHVLATRDGAHVAPHQLLGTMHAATQLSRRLAALWRAKWGAQQQRYGLIADGLLPSPSVDTARVG